MVGANGTLSQGIKMFKFDTGAWPVDLQDLLERPLMTSIAEKWQGPYLEKSDFLIDGWGHKFRYQADSPTCHNHAGFDLWSAGPDGIDVTPDDITNWSH